MIRVIGAGLIFLAVSGFGLSLSDRLKKRCERLDAYISMLVDMTSMIRWNELTVKQIAETLSERKELAGICFLKPLSELCERGVPFPKAWKTSVDGDKSITSEEKKLLYEIGATLGSTDKQGQLSAMELYRERLERMLSEQREKYAVKGRMYRSLGITAGAMIGIIMI